MQVFGHIDKIVLKWTGDWRDGSAVSSSDCPSRGLRLSSPYPNEDFQPSVARVPEALMPPSCFCGHKHTHGKQTYIQQNTHTCYQEQNLRRKLRHSLLERKGKHQAGKPQMMTAAKELRRESPNCISTQVNAYIPMGKERPGSQDSSWSFYRKLQYCSPLSRVSLAAKAVSTQGPTTEDIFTAVVWFRLVVY